MIKLPSGEVTIGTDLRGARPIPGAPRRGCLYGVVAYSVSQRTCEIGVRSGLATVIGVGLGSVCSVGAALLMHQLLFGVAAWEAPTLATVALVVGIASLVATFLPARRAARINPTEALRTE